jgi:hypothetical protein
VSGFTVETAATLTCLCVAHFNQNGMTRSLLHHNRLESLRPTKQGSAEL